MPSVVGSLGAVSKQFGNRVKQIGITVGTAQVQKTVPLGTASILRKVFEIFGYSFALCQLSNNDNSNNNNNNNNNIAS